MFKSLLKNKKFWSAIALAAAVATGSAVDPRILQAVSIAATAVIEASTEAPSTESLPVSP